MSLFPIQTGILAPCHSCCCCCCSCCCFCCSFSLLMSLAWLSSSSRDRCIPDQKVGGSVFEPLNLRFGQVRAGGVLVEVRRGSSHDEGGPLVCRLGRAVFRPRRSNHGRGFFNTVVSIHRSIRRWGVGGFEFEPLYSPSGSAVRSCIRWLRRILDDSQHLHHYSHRSILTAISAPCRLVLQTRRVTRHQWTYPEDDVGCIAKSAGQIQAGFATIIGIKPAWTEDLQVLHCHACAEL
jgi:hypothetical protein